MPNTYRHFAEALEELIKQGQRPAKDAFMIERMKSRVYPNRVNIFVTAATEAECWTGIDAADGNQATFTAPVRTADGEYISIGHEQS